MKLSIITINYNNCIGLQRTIDSIVSQTWRDFEWIIIDGGSTDGSKELIEKYQNHFAYWCSEHDKGIYNALNKGISHCNGGYISCMNSGDTFFENETLEKVFSVERKSDVLYGDTMQIYSDHTRMEHITDKIELYTFYNANICHQSMFIRTEILKEKGFDESYKIAADFSRWVEAVYDGNSFQYVNLIVSQFDKTGVSSMDKSLLDKEYERAFRKLFPDHVKMSMERIRTYEREYVWDPLIRYYLKPLEKKGNTAQAVTKFILRILNKVF